MRDEPQLELRQQISPTLAYRGNQVDNWQRTLLPLAARLVTEELIQYLTAE